MNKKYWKKFLAASILVVGLNFTPTLINLDTENLQVISVAYAEIKNVTAKDVAILDFADESAEYTAKVQSVAKMRAIQRARERAGVYLKSFSRTVNGVLTADDISAYTSDKIEVSDVKFQKLFYQVKDVNGNLTGKIGFMYEATVTAKIDTTGLNDYIQKSLQEKQRLIDRDKNLKDNVNEISKKYEDLRQNAQNKTPDQIKSELEQINKKIEETEKKSVEQSIQSKNADEDKNRVNLDSKIQMAKEYYRRADEYYKSANKVRNPDLYRIELLNKAIELYPSYENAYHLRAKIYWGLAISVAKEKGKNSNEVLEIYKKVIDDFTKAIKFHKKGYNLPAKHYYYWRGSCYESIGEEEKAKADYRKYQELFFKDEDGSSLE